MSTGCKRLSSHARKSKGSASGHCKGVQAESSPAAKSGLGIMVLGAIDGLCIRECSDRTRGMA